MKKRFEVTDHTADIGIIAYGGSLAELMVNSAAGMVSLMMDTASIEESINKTVELSEPDTVTLLVKWLNELLYMFDADRMIFGSFDIVMHGDTRLTAVCGGEKYTPARHRITREIKAATYHNLDIVKEKDGYSARIIFDI